MFESIMNFFKKLNKKEDKETSHSREAAKERLHLVLMQDRANVSADFLELMKQEIIEVIKKYIDVDEEAIDVRLTNQENEEGTNGAPALYANIPIVNIKNEARKVDKKEEKKAKDTDTKKEDKKKEKQNKKQEENEQEDEKKVEILENEEETEIVEEIQNERIAKVILEGRKYNEKKEDKKKKTNEKIEEQKEEKEDTKKEQQEEELLKKEEETGGTKEEKLKSED